MKRTTIILKKYFNYLVNNIILPFSLTFLLSLSCIAQYESASNDTMRHNINRIRFVNKFPMQQNTGDKGIFDWVIKFVFGKNKDVLLIRPISVFADNPNAFWVLDQGLESVVNVQENVGHIPHHSDIQFSSLVGICKSKHNNLFFTDSRLNKIYTLDREEDNIFEFTTNDNLKQPTGIAYSSKNDELWVVETALHHISIFNMNGTLVRQIGSRGSGEGEFNFPTFIWIDKNGLVYIVDSMNFRIQIFNSNGDFITTFGHIGDATGSFSRPKGIATDSFGNIYVVDALFHAVQIFDIHGNFLYHFGSQGSEDGQFWMPTGIYIDENDYIYIADSYNSRIQVFQLINGQMYDGNED